MLRERASAQEYDHGGQQDTKHQKREEVAEHWGVLQISRLFLTQNGLGAITLQLD